MWEGTKMKSLELTAYKMAREQAKKMVWTPPELQKVIDRINKKINPG